MWAALASFFLGVVGWAFAKLLFEPLKEIIDLRRRVQECLIIHGNVSKDAPAEERYAAAAAYRHVGAGLASRHVAAYPWVKWVYETRLRWDIHSAGAFLINIGNATQKAGFSFANASPIVMLIRECLRLPSPEKPAMIRALEEHASQPASDEPLNCG